MQFRRNVKQQSSSRFYEGNASPSNPNTAGGTSAQAHQQIQALRSRVAELELLSEIRQHQKSAFFAVCSATSSLNSSRDLPRLLRAIYAALLSLDYKFDSFHVSIINPDEQHPLIVHHAKSDDEVVITTEHYDDYMQAPQLATWRSQEAKYFPDMGSNHPFSLFAAKTVPGIRCAIDVPFDQGTLTICSKQIDTFAFPSVERALETLQILTYGLSVGLHRLTDFLQVESGQGVAQVSLARVSEETILQLAVQHVRNMAMRMEHEEDWLGVVKKCHDELLKLAYFDRFSVYFFDEKDCSLFAFTVNRRGQVDKGDPFTVTPSVQELLQGRQPLHYSKREELVKSGLDALHNVSAESSVDAPFESGVLSISCSKPYAFTERDVTIATHFASVITEAYRRLQDIVLLHQRQQMLLQAQKMESVGQLATGIAHNFNNMLQVILGNIHMSKTETNFTNRRTMLDNAYSAALRSADIVRQLLVTVRPQTNPITQSLNLVSYVEGIVDLARQTFDQRIDITLSIADDLPPIESDGDQLEQAILNILINARDAVENLEDRFPQISIDVSESPQRNPENPTPLVCIRVTDNGVGMDPATRERAFEPFFTTKSIDKATGLGLPMTNSIVRQQGGTVTLQSTIGQGSTVSIFLPTTSLHVPIPMRKTILVVEDDEPVRISLVDIMQHVGYHVVSANNGREGLEAFHRVVPDLVMLDLSMPEMSGHELLKEIRKVNTEIKILVCTGYAMDGEDFGQGTMILNKPFIVADLVKAIEQLLQSTNNNTKE